MNPRRDLLIAWLAAAAVAVHLLESALPGPGPWFKPGLANVFTLVAYVQLGWRAAVLVGLLRVVAGSLVLGTFLTPTFLLSLSGGVAAVGVLGVGRLPGVRLGVVGLSLLASLAHMVAQVVVAAWVIVGHGGLLMVLPWFLMGSWVTGVMNGLLAFLIVERMVRWRHLLVRV